MHILFNKSLSSGIFPRFWKSSKIVLIHKKGDKSDVSHYRPISILYALSKLFEKIVTKRIYANCRHLLSHCQHGFIDRRSTCSNLVSLKSYIIEAMEDGSQVDAVYTDFSKAFDSVNHIILICKLSKFGFG